MATVFVSHAASGRASVERVVEVLREAGIESLFVDVDPRQGIPAGRDWEAELYARLRQAEALVVVVDAAAADSTWVAIEVSVARMLRRPVLPLRTGSDVGLGRLSDVQWTDLSDPAWPERLVAGLLAAGIDPDDAFAWDGRRPPYPGLAAFAPEDAAVFFARDRETRRLVQLLRGPGREGVVVAVAGPSGSGKSSLVHAGLVPRLRRLGGWVVLPTVVPGREPVSNLLRALEGDPGDDLVRLLDGVAPPGPTGTRPDVLLVVDQAEELLTRADPEQQQRFLDLLVATRAAEPRVSVVLAVRPEFLSGTPDRAGLAGLVDETVLVEPVDRARLGEVVVGPARRAGVEFEAGLVERLVAETPGGDALPLLAYTLRELVDGGLGPDRRVTAARYDEIGGVLGALENRAGKVAAGLGRSGLADLVVPTLLRFVHFAGGEEPVGRPVERTELDERERAVVDAFVDARLLASGGDGTVRLAHEALLRRWSPLVEAIRENVDALRLRSELGRLADDWARNDREDSYLLGGLRLARAWELRERVPVSFTDRERDYLDRSRERERRAAARRWWRRRAVAAGVVLALVLGTVAVYQGVIADREGRSAASRALAVASNDTAAVNPANAANLALAAYGLSPTAEAEQALFARYRETEYLEAVYSGAPGDLDRARVSRDGTVVAALTDRGLPVVWSRGPDGTVRQQQVGPQSAALGLDQDGATVWLKRAGVLSRIDVATGTVTDVARLGPDEDNGTDLEISADGALVATKTGTVTDVPVLRVRDAATGRIVADLPETGGQFIRSFGFGPDHDLVLSLGLGGATLARWTPGAVPAILVTDVRAHDVAPGSGTVVVCTAPDSPLDLAAPVPPGVISAVRVADGVATGRPVPVRSCTGLAADPSGRFAVDLNTAATRGSYGDDSRLIDLAAGTSIGFRSPLGAFAGTSETGARMLSGLVAGPDGLRVAVVDDNRIALVGVPRAGARPDAVVQSDLLSDGSSRIAVTDQGRSLAVTPTDRSDRSAVVVARPEPVWLTRTGDLVTDPDDRLVVDRVAGDRVQIRRLPDLTPVAELPTPAVGPSSTQGSLFFNGASLVSVVEGDVTVWEPDPWRPVAHLVLPGSGRNAPAVRQGPAPGELMVVFPDRPDVHVLDARTGRERSVVPTGPDVLAAFADSSGQWMSLLRRGGAVEVWDLRAGRRVIGPVASSAPGVEALASIGIVRLADDGSLLLGGGSRIRTWGVGSSAPTRTLDLGGGETVGGGTGDGQVVLTRPVLGDGPGRALSLRPEDWRAELCRVIGNRPFSPAERDALPADPPSGSPCS